MTLIRACMPAARAAAEAGTIRIAFIDPLGGAFANAGESGMRHFRVAFDRINARGGAAGYRFELVALANKGQVQEAMAQLRRAAHQGIRFIVQGQSSAVALALIEAIAKHNAREPALMSRPGVRVPTALEGGSRLPR